MIEQPRKPIGEIVRQQSVIDHALGRAVEAALSRHKRLGQSVAVYRDGQVVRLRADEIELPGPDEGGPRAD